MRPPWHRRCERRLCGCLRQAPSAAGDERIGKYDEHQQPATEIVERECRISGEAVDVNDASNELKHAIGEHHHERDHRHAVAVDTDRKKRKRDRDERARAEEARSKRWQGPWPELADPSRMQEKYNAEAKLHERRNGNN